MAQVGNSEDRFGGEYMVQDRDHMGETSQVTDKANRGRAKQADQSQQQGRQQVNGNRYADDQQGDDWQRQSD
jgi:hypothetical protein